MGHRGRHREARHTRAVGQFTLAVAVCAPVMVATGLGLRTVQANDVGGQRPFAVYLGLRLTTTIVAVMAIALVAASDIGPALPSSSRMPARRSPKRSARSCGRSCNSRNAWRRLRVADHEGRYSRDRGTVTLAITHDLVIATVALAVAWFATLAGYDLVVARTFDQPLRPRFERAPLERLARTALPLGIVMMLGSYAANVPRYVVDHFHGARELGVFSAIANLMLIGTTLMTALGQAATPRLPVHSSIESARALAPDPTSPRCCLRSRRRRCRPCCPRRAANFGVAVHTRLRVAMRVLVVIMLAGLATNLASVFGVIVTASGEYSRQIALQVINLVVVFSLAWSWSRRMARSARRGHCLWRAPLPCSSSPLSRLRVRAL